MAKIFGINSLEGYSYGFRNAIQGGDFGTNPWQRASAFSSVSDNQAIRFTDRWVYEQNSSVRVTLPLKTADAPTVAQAGVFTDTCLHVDVTTADTSVAATDYAVLYHVIEGYVWKEFAQRPMVLSFWVKSTKTGIYSVAIRNGANDRYFLAEYTVNASNTWEKKIIYYPASPSSGTWDYTNGTGLLLLFSLMMGSNNTGTPTSAWTNGAYKFASTNQVNAVDSTANDFKMALVQLESGVTATDFEARDWVTELKLCQRYLCKTFPINTPPAQNTSNAGALYAVSPSTNSFTMGNSFLFPVPMRTTPTITTFKPVNGSNSGWNSDSGNVNVSEVGALYAMERNGIYIANGAATSAQTSHNIHVLASAEF